MKAKMSITDANDLTVDLSVSVPTASLSQLFADSESESSSADHAQSFLQSLSGMPSALLQARETISRNLLASSYNNLKPKEKQNA